MENHSKKVVLVTGASSGIGRVAAQRFAEAGHTVFGTSRAPGAGGPQGVSMLALDVADAASVEACVGAVLAEAGRIDVLVSNAGRMVFGPAEEVPLAEAQQMFETNFWGAARLVNAVLPAMRTRGRGHVVFVGSVAASVAIPLNAYYAASKAALARYSEALRQEVQHLGVRVTLVEPGDVRTRFWESARVVPSQIPAYASLRARGSRDEGLAGRGDRAGRRRPDHRGGRRGRRPRARVPGRSHGPEDPLDARPDAGRGLRAGPAAALRARWPELILDRTARVSERTLAARVSKRGAGLARPTQSPR